MSIFLLVARAMKVASVLYCRSGVYLGREYSGQQTLAACSLKVFMSFVNQSSWIDLGICSNSGALIKAVIVQNMHHS